ncbi:cystatin [Austrofundulus limnaeus]|uniref:Cystatin n=1 Tax=Austrofundulus limnaeus TaxID=52670 RepID=A0A2I4D7N4_AUSLI|nr:PREDICTED: cystatin-like [Austrofundulus limnaeus]
MWKIVFLFLAASFAVGNVTLVGGFRKVDPKDEGVQNALRFAIAEHNRRSNDMYLSNAAEVIEAQSQVVSGLKYTLTVRMAKTSCRKSAADESCPVHSDPEKARPYICTFTVWSRPWLNDIQLEKQKC